MRPLDQAGNIIMVQPSLRASECKFKKQVILIKKQTERQNQAKIYVKIFQIFSRVEPRQFDFTQLDSNNALCVASLHHFGVSGQSDRHSSTLPVPP
jgi:hypothetical protein